MDDYARKFGTCEFTDAAIAGCNAITNESSCRSLQNPNCHWNSNTNECK